MLTAILIIFVALLLLLIFIEYKNEKKYQEERKRKKEHKKDHRKESKEEHQEDLASSYKTLQTPNHTPKIEPTPQTTSNDIQLKTQKKSPSEPKTKYPQFTHARLVDMGFSDDEAEEFVTELIPQIETQIPLIHEAIKSSDFYQVERLTHHIKGSATNIGTGGVSDLLVEYNTYLKRGTDITIVKSYFQDLIQYTKELKLQYA